MSVTQSELADALGVSTRTIERWAAAGMPVLEQRAAQGRPRYNLAQCRKWAAERPTQGRHKPARAKGAPELGPRALEPDRRLVRPSLHPRTGPPRGRPGMPSLAVRGAYRSPRYDLRVCQDWASNLPTQGRSRPTRPPSTPDSLILNLRSTEPPEPLSPDNPPCGGIELPPTPAERLEALGGVDGARRTTRRRPGA